MTRACFRLLPPALLLALSACAPLSLAPPAPPPPKTAAVTPAPPRERAPMPPRQSKPAKAPRPAEPAPPAIAPKLVGLTEAEAADLLGVPSEEAAQPPGKIWVYRAEGCTLSVHLFPDVQKGGFHALDYTVEGGGRDACLAKVATAARKE